MRPEFSQRRHCEQGGSIFRRVETIGQKLNCFAGIFFGRAANARENDGFTQETPWLLSQIVDRHYVNVANTGKGNSAA